jgi:hypothetical protein
MKTQSFTLIILLGLGLHCSCVSAQQPARQNLASAAAPLHKAREGMRLAEATEERIRRDLAAAEAKQPADPGLVAEYRQYLDRVHRMAETYREMVGEMEKIAGPELAAQANDPGAGIDATATPEATLPNRDELDPIQALERELDQTLSEFDKILLKENSEIGAKMEEVTQSNNAKLEELAQQAAESAAKIKQKQSSQSGSAEGEGAETAEGEARDPAGSETAGQKPGGKPGSKPGENPGETGEGTETAEAGQPGTQTAGGPKPGGAAGDNTGSDTATGTVAGNQGGKTGPGQKPGERKVVHPGAEDDDIVARQLREAAEAETDPVLKEKLWKEYEDYKKSTRR